jgi:hypothetical protein
MSAPTLKSLIGRVPSSKHPAFWPAAAIQDALVFESFPDFGPFVGLTDEARTALHFAKCLLRKERDKSFEEARKEGTLLYAWEGSTAVLAAFGEVA